MPWEEYRVFTDHERTGKLQSMGKTIPDYIERPVSLRMFIPVPEK